MELREDYRGYVISWQEPRMMSAEWVVNVASEDRWLQDKIGKGAKVISGQSRSQTVAKAKSFIDGLLG